MLTGLRSESFGEFRMLEALEEKLQRAGAETEVTKRILAFLACDPMKPGSSTPLGEEATPTELPVDSPKGGEASSESDKEAENSGKEFTAPGTWLISRSRANLCLHVVGLCHRKPGVHFKSWRITSDAVQTSEYNKVCRLCFPLGFPVITSKAADEPKIKVQAGMPEEVAEDDGSSSSSSSSSNSE